MTKSKADIVGKSVFVRKLLNIESTKPIRIFDELKKREEFTIVFIPLSENIRGFSHNENGHKIIIINANDTEPQQNFSCAHELYHLYFNYDKKFNLVHEENNERIADVFAGAFLIPQESLYIYLQENKINPLKISEKQLCEMDRYFGVSRSALVIRLKEEGLIDNRLAKEYSSNVKIKAAHNGFDVKYYEHNEDKFETIGEYIRLAEDLYNSGKITRSKYNSYLLDAFRDDIVYNLPKDNNGNNKK